VAISEAAWEIIEKINYTGYDALLPFRLAKQNFVFPYTPYWQGMAALHKATEILLAEGLPESFKRHAETAAYCRTGLTSIGLSLFPAPDAVLSPTVTAVKVPHGIPWKELDARMRYHGLVVGGSYGPLESKVFRLGHMGTQANLELVKAALEVIKQAIR
jgi:aspartate aminotransferase-like enzyme